MVKSIQFFVLSKLCVEHFRTEMSSLNSSISEVFYSQEISGAHPQCHPYASTVPSQTIRSWAICTAVSDQFLWKSPPVVKKPPLVFARSETRGGFFTFARKFRKFEDFSLRKSLENGVLQEKNVFRALQTVKIFRLRRANRGENTIWTVCECINPLLPFSKVIYIR